MGIRAVIWILVRVVAVAAAIAALFLTPVFTEDAGGRSFLALGIAIDAVAILILAGVAWSVIAGARR